MISAVPMMVAPACRQWVAHVLSEVVSGKSAVPRLADWWQLVSFGLLCKDDRLLERLTFKEPCTVAPNAHTTQPKGADAVKHPACC